MAGIEPAGAKVVQLSSPQMILPPTGSATPAFSAWLIHDGCDFPKSKTPPHPSN